MKQRILLSAAALVLALSLLAGCDSSDSHSSNSSKTYGYGSSTSQSYGNSTSQSTYSEPESSDITEGSIVVETEKWNDTIKDNRSEPEETGSNLNFERPDNLSSANSLTDASDGSPAYIDGINNETILKYDTYGSIIKPTHTTLPEKVYLYNFTKSLSAGIGKDGTAVPTEADYGVQAVVKDRVLYCHVYDHVGGKEVAEFYVQALDASKDVSVKLDFTSTTLQSNTANMSNGLYRLVVVFSDSSSVYMYYYINGDETWLCEKMNASDSYIKSCISNREKFMQVINSSGTTPENSISLDKVWYPCVDIPGSYRCDTDKWVALSNQIVDSSWSDEHKLYTITTWLSENIAYDKYVASNGQSRAVLNGVDFTGKYSVYELRAGVCYDYANICGIMCRAQGIPAITIGSASMNHVWNAVYVNNRWMEVDLVRSNQYIVTDAALTKVKENDPLYACSYRLSIWTVGEVYPSDATANKWWQYNSWTVC